MADKSLVDAGEFLDVLFGEMDEAKETVCVSKGFVTDDGMGFWNVDDREKIFQNWKPAKQKISWYFCVSSVDGEKNAKRNAVLRKTANVVKYYVLVLDDIGTKATPPPIEPTYRLTSSLAKDGTPNEQWGFALVPGTDFKRFEALIEYCHENGWGDAGAGGCYRIMRVPGSTNLKKGRKKFQSVVTHWNPDAYWALDDLALKLGCLDLDKRAVATKGNKRTLHGPVAPLAVDTIDPLFVWLGKQAQVVSDQGGDFVDVECPWADEHTSGGSTAGYSPLGRGSGDWVQARGFRCLHAHCKGRGFKHAMKAWSGMGAPRVSGVDPLPWLQHRYVYIGVGAQVADLEQRKRGGTWLWEFEDWGKMHKTRVIVPGRDTPIEMKAAFLESKATRKVTGTKYWPVKAEKDEPVIVANEQEFVNKYAPPNHAYTKAEPDIFLDHVDFLLPDDDERDLFLDWLAHKLQNPGVRSYAVVMIAEDGYGVGRSWLKSLLAKMLPHMVQSATLPQLIGKGTAAENNYNDWSAECQFLVVEEAKDNMSKDDFYNGYETFKKNVDTSVGEVRVNPKYGRTRDDHMFFNALIFSNHSDALAIPKNDRRVAVLTNPSKMESHAYYDALQGSLSRGEVEQAYWYLMERNVEAFDHVYPPMTKGKQLMTEQNLLPSDEIKNHIVDACPGDILTKKMLKSRVITAAHSLDYEKIAHAPGGMVRTLWGKMGALRSDDRGARYYLNKEQVEVRAIRQKEKWISHDMDRRKNLFEEELLKNDKSGGKGLRLIKQ